MVVDLDFLVPIPGGHEVLLLALRNPNAGFFQESFGGEAKITWTRDDAAHAWTRLYVRPPEIEPGYRG